VQPHSLFERLGQRPGRIATAGPVVGEQPAAIDRGSQLGHGERRGVPTKGSGRRAKESASFVVVQHCWTIVKTEACCPGVDDTPTQRMQWSYAFGQNGSLGMSVMSGRDFESAPLSAWQQCARYLAELQLWKIRQACERVLSRGDVPERSPLVGAGVGRFLVAKLAAKLGRRYRDFDGLVGAAPNVASWASSCAPAVAVAVLAQARIRKRK